MLITVGVEKVSDVPPEFVTIESVFVVVLIEAEVEANGVVTAAFTCRGGDSTPTLPRSSFNPSFPVVCGHVSSCWLAGEFGLKGGPPVSQVSGTGHLRFLLPLHPLHL